MNALLADSGLSCIGDVPWGSHFCQFYKTRGDLIDTLVPFFKAGLQGNEQCLWVASEPFRAVDARRALRSALPDLEEREARGQITILDHEAWYLTSGATDAATVLRGWREQEEIALSRGYRGLRLTGNTYWLEREDWSGFDDYESHVTACFSGRHIIGLCSYCLDRVHSEGIIDVVRNHQFAVVRREGSWEVLENAALKLAKAELHRLNEELEHRVRERTSELEAMLRIRDEFLTVASHELKTPVAALKLFVDGILRATRERALTPEELHRRLTRAERQCARLNVLITRLLDVSRTSEGSFEVKSEPLDFAEIVRTACEQAADEAGVPEERLAVHLPRRLPGLGDAVRVEQVVTNLVGNAFKHAPGAAVVVTLEDLGDGVAIEVEDDGPGVPDADRERIFGRFVRGGDGTYTTGFGLGLWVVRQAVTALGGTVELVSAPEPGTTFRVVLPKGCAS